MANRDFIYGRQPVREVLRAGKRRLISLYLGDGVNETPDITEIIQLAAQHGVKVQRVKRHRLDQMAGDHGNHQGVALESGRYTYADWNALVADSAREPTSHNPVILLLDRIQDPQNLGSLLRSADAFGVLLVVLPKDRAAHVTPAVVRASAGASEHVPTCIVTNIVRCQSELQSQGIPVYGLETGPETIALEELRADGPVALVVGSEGQGLRRLVKENCTSLISIPMHGNVNSLNAGIAGAIALNHLAQPKVR